MKVTRESFQERLNMKKMTPVAFTTLRRKMLMFWETRSLTMVVSDVRREMTSPAATRGQGGGEQGRVTMAGHCLTVSHIPCQGPDGAPHPTSWGSEGRHGRGATLHCCGHKAKQRSLDCCMHEEAPEGTNYIPGSRKVAVGGAPPAKGTEAASWRGAHRPHTAWS